MSRFAGLRVIVTGGASGIGAATVVRLRAEGARVVVLDRTGTGDSDEVLADLRDSLAVEAAVDTAVGRFGGLDVLVNNAGIGSTGDITQATDEEWARLWDVNVVGIARASRAAIPYLRESTCAAIVNTSSVVATVGVPQRAVYAATKGAVLSLTLAMAADLAADGIRVNAVAPGTADTPWVGRLLNAADDPSAARAALAARQPIGRLITADEVAAAITYLCDPTAQSTTGSVVVVDGGMSHLRLPTPIPPAPARP